jgi:ElaB/YqjD/DUF883 family membrane-anchored ribosome-binding protein
MADETITPNSDTTPEPGAADPAKSHFAKAVEEAKAGAKALGREAQERAGAYREKAQERADAYREKAHEKAGSYREMANERGTEWMDEARVRGEEAKVRAAELAKEGKANASKALTGLGKMVDDNAALLDEKVGTKYGDYARRAASTMQDAGTRLDSKELEELADDAREFVRKSPGLAVGIAAAAGFVLARMLGGSRD